MACSLGGLLGVDILELMEAGQVLLGVGEMEGCRERRGGDRERNRLVRFPATADELHRDVGVIVEDGAVERGLRREMRSEQISRNRSTEDEWNGYRLDDQSRSEGSIVQPTSR